MTWVKPDHAGRRTAAAWPWHGDVGEDGKRTVRATGESTEVGKPEQQPKPASAGTDDKEEKEREGKR